MEIELNNIYRSMYDDIIRITEISEDKDRYTYEVISGDSAFRTDSFVYSSIFFDCLEFIKAYNTELYRTLNRG